MIRFLLLPFFAIILIFYHLEAQVPEKQTSVFVVRDVYPAELTGNQVLLDYFCPEDVVLNYELKHKETGEQYLAGTVTMCGGDHFQLFSLGDIPEGGYALSMTDNESTSVVEFKKIQARGEPELNSSEVDLKWDKDLILVGKEVAFEASFPEKVKGYFWDFGDGHTSRAVNPVHTYRHEGEYEVMLVVLGEGDVYSVVKKAKVVMRE